MSSFSKLAVALLALPAMVSAMPAVKPTTTSATLDVVSTTTSIQGNVATGAPLNATQTYVPVAPASGSKSSSVDPKYDVNVAYAPADGEAGSISMALDLQSPAVLLEDIEEIKDVACSNTKVQVSFSDATAYATALSKWASKKEFVLITNHGANCNTADERGFFSASSVSGDKASKTISVTAIPVDMTKVTKTIVMDFNNMPAGLSKRMPLINGTTPPINFGMSLPPNTKLYSEDNKVSVFAEHAWFNATISLTGTLKFHLHNLKFETLSFDVNLEFDASAKLSADAQIEIQKAFSYAPHAFSWHKTVIPKVLTFGPSVQFALGASFDLQTSAKLDTDVDFHIPAGRMHVNMLQFNQSKFYGFEDATYGAHVTVDEAIKGDITPSAEIKLDLGIELFNNTVDLSSGVVIKPMLQNKFELFGTQGIGMDGTGKDISAAGNLPASCDSSIKNGVHLVSDFFLDVDGYVSKKLHGHMFNWEKQVADRCFSIPQINTTIV